MEIEIEWEEEDERRTGAGEWDCVKSLPYSYFLLCFLQSQCSLCKVVHMNMCSCISQQ